MAYKLTFLPTDILIFLLFFVTLAVIIWSIRDEHWRIPWRQVTHHRLGMAALVILAAYAIVGLLDSIHFQTAIAKGNDNKTYYSYDVKSLLDIIVAPLGEQDEESYSAPLATHLYTKSTVLLPNGTIKLTYPRLNYVNPHADMLLRILLGSFSALISWMLINLLIIAIMAKRYQQTFWQQLKRIYLGQTPVAWREILIIVGIVIWFIALAIALSTTYHLLGTDKVGNDVFYEAIKSIRTALIIGTLTTLIMLPFAVILGMLAGYFSGWLDDVIQYIYTTLSSIPAVLLITAAILSLQIYIDNHPQYFSTLSIRADIRLLALCAILGITSWTTLCRLLRAETLKLRETDFVTAAISLGTNRSRILLTHIFPNVLHIILITVVLDFSGLVLAEAVLSYVGVGVDPTTLSWGNMINSARLELAREPAVWWPLTAAFVFMFILVLAANLFADAVRDAFDPRLKNVD